VGESNFQKDRKYLRYKVLKTAAKTCVLTVWPKVKIQIRAEKSIVEQI
jgi:hypothetical protein